MRKHLLTTIALIYLLLLTGCFSDPNKKANELYVQATATMKNISTETKSYSKVYEYYKSAREDIERILSKYPSSNLAVNLSSGETRISNFELREFRGLERSLRQLAAAEQNPFSCALLVAKTIESEYLKASALTYFAGKYAEAGQKEKSTQLLSQALETAKTIESEYLKASALAYIAGKYAEAREFTQALETAKTIKDVDDKADALADIAGKYAEAGQKEKSTQLLSQALETTKTIKVVVDKAFALADIAGKYAEAEQKLNMKDVAHLRDIVQTIRPMGDLWE